MAKEKKISIYYNSIGNLYGLYEIYFFIVSLILMFGVAKYHGYGAIMIHFYIIPNLIPILFLTIKMINISNKYREFIDKK